MSLQSARSDDSESTFKTPFIKRRNISPQYSYFPGTIDPVTKKYYSDNKFGNLVLINERLEKDIDYKNLFIKKLKAKNIENHDGKSNKSGGSAVFNKFASEIINNGAIVEMPKGQKIEEVRDL